MLDVSANRILLLFVVDTEYDWRGIFTGTVFEPLCGSLCTDRVRLSDDGSCPITVWFDTSDMLNADIGPKLLMAFEGDMMLIGCLPILFWLATDDVDPVMIGRIVWWCCCLLPADGSSCVNICVCVFVGAGLDISAFHVECLWREREGEGNEGRKDGGRTEGREGGRKEGGMKLEMTKEIYIERNRKGQREREITKERYIEKNRKGK